MGRGVSCRDDILIGEYVLKYEANKTYSRSEHFCQSRNNNHIYVSYRKERAKFEEEYSSNGEGVFIFDIQDPLDGSWKCLDATRVCNAFSLAGCAMLSPAVQLSH